MAPSRHQNTIIFCLLINLLAFYLPSSDAANKILIPSPPTIAAKSFILQDANSGKVMAENNADEKLAPASLTKIMSVYVVFNELSKGHLSLDEMVTISKKAWQTPGSRMFVEVNKQVSISDLLKGVIIQSGNDASVALSEHIAGDESTFAEMMNQQAAKLGMTNTHYSNSMGLPSPDHYTTARDLSTLTRALIREYPDYYRWFSEKEFTYNEITQRNRNHLLWRDETVDGVKTGHTEEAGYCLVASAVRDGMRLISVVMGTESERARANENQNLLNYGFRFFETHRLYKANETLAETRVWKGNITELNMGLPEDLYVTIPRRHYSDLTASMTYNERMIAPIEQGESVGKVNVKLIDQTIVEKDLIALSKVKKGNLFRRMFDSALLLLK